MRLFLPLLPLALCGAVAQAQPDIIPPQQPTVPQPPVNVGPPVTVNAPLVPRTGTSQEQIKADLNQFVTNLNSNKAFMTNDSFIYGVKYGYLGANEWANNWKDLQIQVKFDDLTIDNIEGNQATITIRYHAQAKPKLLNELFTAHANRGAVQGMVETLKLRKEQMWDKQYWQIVPPEKLDPADPQTGILSYVTYVLAQKGEVPTDALPYVFNTEANASLTQLKQLGLGVMMFAQDYDEIYSLRPQYVQEALAPYIKSTQLFRIPASQQSYSFNANLSGQNLAAIAEPARTVLFYEGQNQQPLFHYDGKAAIAFVDGHCVLVSPEEFKKVIWDVQQEKG